MSNKQSVTLAEAWAQALELSKPRKDGFKAEYVVLKHVGIIKGNTIEVPARTYSDGLPLYRVELVRRSKGTTNIQLLQSQGWALAPRPAAVPAGVKTAEVEAGEPEEEQPARRGRKPKQA